MWGSRMVVPTKLRERVLETQLQMEVASPFFDAACGTRLFVGFLCQYLLCWYSWSSFGVSSIG